MNLLVILAIVLLVGGVAGTLFPYVPGITASLAGVYLYWWSTGYSEPSTLLLAAITVLGLVAILAGILEDVAAAKLGGASTKTAIIAGIVGAALLVLTGPIGMLVGTALAVFVLEYRRQRDVRAGARAALTVVAGTVGSRIFQLLLALLILLAMLVVILL